LIERHLARKLLGPQNIWSQQTAAKFNVIGRQVILISELNDLSVIGQSNLRDDVQFYPFHCEMSWFL